MTNAILCRAGILILATALRITPVAAQSPVTSLRFQPYPAYLGRGPTRIPVMAPADSDSVRTLPQETYWKEGALIGGGALGLFTGYVAMHVCDQDSSCVSSTLGAGLIGAVMGAVIGGFAGSFIEKK